MRRVAITGMGVVSPNGVGCAAFRDALLEARSGIRVLSPRLAERLGVNVAGEVDFDAGSHFSKMQLGLLDRFSQFALLSAREAIRHAGVVFENDRGNRAGVFVGTGMGGAATVEAGYEDLFLHGKDRLPPYSVLRCMNNAAAAHISMEFGLRGPTYTYSTACSSSAIAIGEAYRAIRHGYVDVAIAGGAESLLTHGVLRAWEALRVLAVVERDDPGASCRPFSKDRTGLVLGEGAGFVVLEAMTDARARGAPVIAELAGFGAASDASHISKPDKMGQVRAMQLAMEDASLGPESIDYINAHGTATPAGDVIETSAIKALFGDFAGRIPVSSTKSMHGHLMGAAGAVEFIAAVLALVHRKLPPTANLRVPDPECDLDYVPNTARSVTQVKAVMSNSFAFGGSNAVLIATAP